jgi:hypothetical protein
MLVLRPFFTAVCFALILVVATWPAFDRLQGLLGGRRSLAALLMGALATLVLVAPPALLAASVDYNVAGIVRLLHDVSPRGVPARRSGSPRSTLSVRSSMPAGRHSRRAGRGGGTRPGVRRVDPTCVSVATKSPVELV